MENLTLLLLQLLACLSLGFYLYFCRRWCYWSSRGIPGPPPGLLQFGNTLDRIRKSPADFELQQMAQYGLVYGRYRGLQPTLTVNDPALIKQVMVKDFHLFVNKQVMNTYDKYWNLALFNAESDRWKRVRAITSPTFSSGKLRAMRRLMGGCVEKLADYFDTVIAQQGGRLDVKQVLAGFTVDVIASSAFATETNANGDRSGENPIVANGIKLFQMNPLKLLAFLVLPRPVNDLLGVRHQFVDRYFYFFSDLSREIVKQRKCGASGKRNDLVQLLVDAFVLEDELKENNYDKLTANMENEVEVPETIQSSSSQSKKSFLTEDEIIAQCVIFMIAGYETTSNTLVHCMHELTQNATVQSRLVDELNSQLAGLDESSEGYLEAVMTACPYLGAVVKETLRKHPPVTRLERRVGVAGYQLGDLLLEKDQVIEVSTYAVHHNPENYPEPERFNPERFLPENKHLLRPYTYLPFGVGPRNCVGMRFAYQEIHLCLAKILRKFRLEPTEDTPTKLRYKFASLLLNSYPFTIKISRR